MGIKLSNFARAQLATPPSGTGGLSFTVAAGKGALFPTLTGADYFYGVFSNASKTTYEVVKITARSSDSFTIDAAGRGIDGTSAATWTTSDFFYYPLTKKALEEVPFSVAVTALSALTPAADKLAYWTGASTAANTSLTSYARTLLDDADAATARATLGSTSVGDAVFIAADAAAARTVLGFSDVGFTTGDVKLTLKTVADSGWVLMNDGSIGDASSGATSRANADTSALFTLLWNNTSNADCPVSTGRGVSAAADFAAHKTLTLPKALGRALATYGSGSGLTARTLGQSLGSENSITVAHTHTGTTTTDGSHTHTNPYPVWQASGSSNLSPTGGSNQDVTTLNLSPAGSHNHTFTTDSAGSSGTGANMPPTVFLNVMIKL